MNIDKPCIDAYLFEQQFTAFKSFIKEKSKIDFFSFTSNPYVYNQEGYKYEIHRLARNILAYEAWKASDIGTGDILDSAIKAIEMTENNLVQWHGKYGKDSKPHRSLLDAREKDDKGLLKSLEACLYGLYCGNEDKNSFSEMISLLGKKYSLLAYLFFLKDYSKYLPIAPSYFDKAFEVLGVSFKTSMKCSWENYTNYIDLLKDLKSCLEENMSNEVTLLDAHSFAWILASQMDNEGKLADTSEYLNLPLTERKAIVDARIGQGKFRNRLIRYWSACAVTECKEVTLLRASHIKPWSSLRESPLERLSLYNGLLLSPNLDACFDSGFITFDDEGKIILSNQLNSDDAAALGIHDQMRLSKIEPEHKKYLEFHRNKIFR